MRVSVKSIFKSIQSQTQEMRIKNELDRLFSAIIRLDKSLGAELDLSYDR